MNTALPCRFNPQTHSHKVSVLLSELRSATASHEISERWLNFFRTHYSCDTDCSGQTSRYRDILEKFASSFDSPAVSFARAPGRVNIIGEHTDYNAGPVLPIAIDRDVVAAFAPRHDGVVRIVNLDDAYAPREFRVSSRIEPFGRGDWGNYVKAAVEKLSQTFAPAAAGPGHAPGPAETPPGGPGQAPGAAGTPPAAAGPPPGATGPPPAATGYPGFDAVVHSTIPPAAGLSSSSALVVLAGAMYLSVNNLQIDAVPFAELMAEAEHYVGTRGGGMDQTISTWGQAGYALQIDFSRSTRTHVPVPREHTFVIAHSLVHAPKSESAMASYNHRAAESRIAGELFRRELEKELERPVEAALIGHLRRYRESVGRTRFDRLAATAFHEHAYSEDEVASRIGSSVAELREKYGAPDLAADADVAGYESDGTGRQPGSIAGYKLFQRFAHVLHESSRVERLAGAMQAGDFVEAGRLMNESHESCRDLYEISCRELDALVEVERRAGALGARMTGAGFGGCTVYLVENTRVGESIREVVEKYYKEARGLSRVDFSDLIFPVSAVTGVSFG